MRTLGVTGPAPHTFKLKTDALVKSVKDRGDLAPPQFAALKALIEYVWTLARLRQHDAVQAHLYAVCFCRAVMALSPADPVNHDALIKILKPFASKSLDVTPGKAGRAATDAGKTSTPTKAAPAATKGRGRGRAAATSPSPSPVSPPASGTKRGRGRSESASPAPAPAKRQRQASRGSTREPAPKSPSPPPPSKSRAPVTASPAAKAKATPSEHEATPSEPARGTPQSASRARRMQETLAARGRLARKMTAAGAAGKSITPAKPFTPSTSSEERLAAFGLTTNPLAKRRHSMVSSPSG